MQGTGRPEPQRIAKLLARAGVASRREIERMIAEGRVALDGRVLDTAATLLPSLRGVTVDGEPVQEAAPARLFVFHKPAGVLTAAFDPRGRRTIYDVLPGDLPRLIPVGRLDLNTEGLLLLTTDGELKRQLELPATGVERAYRARAYGDVTQAQLEDLIDGVEVDGVRYGSIDANLERRTGANVWVEMVLTEGKNREVRRVLEYLGLQVSRLIRTRYGPFILGDLPVGGVGEVRQVDLIQFRASLRGNKAKALEEARANPVAVRAPEKRAARPPETATPSAEQYGDRRRTAPVADRPSARVAGPSNRQPRGGASAPRTPRDASRREDPAIDGARRPATPAVRPGAKPARAAVRRDAPPVERPVAATPARKMPEREDLTTRPRRAMAGPVTERTEAKPRPKRGAGWAKAKPKARPGRPRKPRA